MNQNYYSQNISPYPLPTSGLAVTSMICGILGFTGLGLVTGIIALVTGYAARGETRSIPPRASGDGMATAGIVMGWIQVGLVVVAICCFLGFWIMAIVADSGLQ